MNSLTQFVAAHAWLGYLTVFLAALLEALPVLGTFIPGTTLILALSALIPSGDLDLIPVLVAAMLGAIIGDGSAYWIGHVRQRAILNTWPLASYPGVVAKSETFFHRFGALAVFFGRFLPPIRAFVPVTAGALDMRPAKFFPINIPAALIWAPAHVLPAVLAVSALDRFGGVTGLEGQAKHYWIPALLLVAICVAAASWWWLRRRRNTAAEPVGKNA